MTTPPSKEAQFKQFFATVLKELRETADQDGQAMLVIGSLATELTDRLGQPSWSAAKGALSQANYDELLGSFQQQGNALHQAGKEQEAYAIQALAVSLVAMTQRTDPEMAAGEKLLDTIIDSTVAVTRKRRPVIN